MAVVRVPVIFDWYPKWDGALESIEKQEVAANHLVKHLNEGKLYIGRSGHQLVSIEARAVHVQHDDPWTIEIKADLEMEINL